MKSNFWKRNGLSIAIGVLIGCLAGLGHIRSAQQWQEQKRQLAEEARAYDAEVRAERERWERMELNEVELAEIEYAYEMEKINEEAPQYDPDIPEEIQDAAWKYGQEYDICPEFLIAIAKKESTFDPKAVNGSCTGLMQVSLYWHRTRMEECGVTEEEMWEIDGNMHVAADYLRDLFEKYDDPAAVLMAYNGDHRLEAYLKGECEMSGYAREILDTSYELEQKHGKTSTAFGSQSIGCDMSKEVVLVSV